ncbi:hypothetical protein PP935_gp116 [Rhizobium phage RHph_N34]|uniref:Uncharacterized protein n=1 Tax=Rhizobium phage RHph_N34 TaxID=2509586 RepID=A0A7S5RE73_9CAUD|nr:hypothetical protein PP935_gp116 [Rhizobium phage RHph_N34]QIG73891.1 hypothetical protein EVC06_116 [Rhizobium phage RHph_N34]
MGQYLRDLRKSRRLHGSLELCTVTMCKNYFTFDAKTKTITCEISDLNWHQDLNLQRRIWLYSEDRGFIATSQKTGEKVLFVLTKTEIDGENELKFLEFTPYKEPKLEGWKLTVFND